MAYIWLQPVDGQHRAPLGKQSLGNAWAVQHMQTDELFVALDEVGHAPLADSELTRLQGAMDLGHAAVLTKALGTHGGDDVKANLAMRQRIAALLFGTVGPTEQRTAVGTAPTDLQPQAHPASEGQDRALLPIAGPERATAADALASIRDQRSRQVGCGLCMCASHGSAPQSNQIPPLPQKPGRTPARFASPVFFPRTVSGTRPAQPAPCLEDLSGEGLFRSLGRPQAHRRRASTTWSSDPLHDRHGGLAAWTICSSMPTIEHGSATTLRPDGSRTLDEVVPHLGGQVNTRLPGLGHHQQREVPAARFDVRK